MARGRFLDRHRTGDLEGHFRRIDIVIAAVVQRHLDIRHRIAGQNAAFQRFLDTRLGRVDVFLRNPAARDIVLELEAGARRQRLHANLDVAVLAVTAGLLDVPAFGFGVLADGVSAAVPGLNLTNIHQANVRFVDEGRGLERLAGRLLIHLVGCQPTEFAVNQGQELLGG